jgi:hypothetical protein
VGSFAVNIGSGGIFMCECNLLNAAISEEGIELICECGNPREADPETTATLELIGQYLRQ